MKALAASRALPEACFEYGAKRARVKSSERTQSDYGATLLGRE